jgi:hypothetical protein
MTDEITQKRRELAEQRIEQITGPKAEGHTVIVEGRLVPNMTMLVEGETVSFTLDHRMTWEGFPLELAAHVASFAANAMAIGAGFPCLTAERKVEHFATPCFSVEMSHDQ